MNSTLFCSLNSLHYPQVVDYDYHSKTNNNYFTPCKFITPALISGFSLKSERQQVSSDLLNRVSFQAPKIFQLSGKVLVFVEFFAFFHLFSFSDLVKLQNPLDVKFFS